MNIWLIDHYSVPVKYYPLARQATFAKYLKRMGHNVIIFAASTVHNSDINLIEKKKKYIEIVDNDIKYILIKCHKYQGNGFMRMFNMVEFAYKLPKVCKRFEKPDAIISTSMTLFACKKGLDLADYFGCKKIAQITDLWPETIVAYGFANSNNPIIKYLRNLEKRIYMQSDKIIFSMEGAYDYIVEQGWTNLIDKKKVEYINNGVDLELFNYNKVNYPVTDIDLKNKHIFKVIYTGSIRKVNNLGKLLDVAKMVQNKNIIFLIWGDGDEVADLLERIKKENIKNVVFKGKVAKSNIPYIVSNADLNIAHNTSSPIFRFGISFNKLFDYFAAGKPIICDFECKYNPLVMTNSGIAVESGDVNDIAKKIDEISYMDEQEYLTYCKNALEASNRYDYAKLTNDLIRIINE